MADPLHWVNCPIVRRRSVRRQPPSPSPGRCTVHRTPGSAAPEWTMPPPTILITGANGEIGHGLVSRLSELGPVRIVALDLHAPDASLQARCHRVVTGDISDIALLDTLVATYDFDVVYHLAALLSTKS